MLMNIDTAADGTLETGMDYSGPSFNSLYLSRGSRYNTTYETAQKDK